MCAKPSQEPSTAAYRKNRIAYSAQAGAIRLVPATTSNRRSRKKRAMRTQIANNVFAIHLRIQNRLEIEICRQDSHDRASFARNGLNGIVTGLLTLAILASNTMPKSESAHR